MGRSNKKRKTSHRTVTFENSEWPPSAEQFNKVTIPPPAEFSPSSTMKPENLRAIVDHLVTLELPKMKVSVIHSGAKGKATSRPTMDTMLLRAVPYIRRIIPNDQQLDNALFHSALATNAMSHIDKVKRFHAFEMYLLANQCKIAVPKPPVDLEQQIEINDNDTRIDEDQSKSSTQPADKQTKSNPSDQSSTDLADELAAAADKLQAIETKLQRARLKVIQEQTEKAKNELRDVFATNVSDLDARMSGTPEIQITDPSKAAKRKQNDDDRRIENDSLLKRIAALEASITNGDNTRQTRNATNIFGKENQNLTQSNNTLPAYAFPKVLVGDDGLKASEFHGNNCPTQIVDKLRGKASITLRAVLAYIERQSIADTFYFELNENNETVQKSRATTSHKFTSEIQFNTVLLALVDGFKQIDTELGEYLARTWPAGFLHLQRTYPLNLPLQEEYLERQLAHIRNCLHKGIRVSATYDHGLAFHLSTRFSNNFVTKKEFDKLTSNFGPKGKGNYNAPRANNLPTPGKYNNREKLPYSGDTNRVKMHDCRNWAKKGASCAYEPCPFKHDPKLKDTVE